MWYDINGNFIESVFRGCLEAVLGLILQNPGICEVDIVSSIFCNSELNSLHLFINFTLTN
jgi:hypothetical protein